MQDPVPSGPGSIPSHGTFLRLFLAAEQDLYRYVCALLPQPQDARDEKLPAEQAGLMRGYYWDRLSVEHLAEQARSSVEAVYKRLQRIRLLLLDCVQRLRRQDETLGGNPSY